ncbi:hypothetical protein COY07_06175 [Candidatus Peregrinibacteria bacterium CG_4_10_14_0_2_um_filter_43_11]|nr:MAG: hypothetical protein COY07_06175 [Candidatus Peregrinibacteria bacterium CG_4_10_14_0_2_um_filter_43_11]
MKIYLFSKQFQNITNRLVFLAPPEGEPDPMDAIRRRAEEAQKRLNGEPGKETPADAVRRRAEEAQRKLEEEARKREVEKPAKPQDPKKPEEPKKVPTPSPKPEQERPVMPGLPPLPEGFNLEEVATRTPDKITGEGIRTNDIAQAMDSALDRAVVQLADEVYKAIYGEYPNNLSVRISTAGLQGAHQLKGDRMTYTFTLTPADKLKLVQNLTKFVK